MMLYIFLFIILSFYSITKLKNGAGSKVFTNFYFWLFLNFHCDPLDDDLFNQKRSHHSVQFLSKEVNWISQVDFPSIKPFLSYRQSSNLHFDDTIWHPKTCIMTRSGIHCLFKRPWKFKIVDFQGQKTKFTSWLTFNLQEKINKHLGKNFKMLEVSSEQKLLIYLQNAKNETKFKFNQHSGVHHCSKEMFFDSSTSWIFTNWMSLDFHCHWPSGPGISGLCSLDFTFTKKFTFWPRNPWILNLVTSSTRDVYWIDYFWNTSDLRS